MNLALSEITIGRRHRKELGGIAALAESIERLGLLHPVVVTSEHKLIAGWRRIKAFKKLGRDKIPVTVAHTLDEALLLLEAERDENTCREDLLPSEAVSIGKATAKIYKPKAEAKQAEGQKRGGKTGGKGRPQTDSSRATYPKAKQDETKRSNEQASKAAGMARRTWEKAKAVVDSGDKELVAEMDRTGKVAGAYKKLRVAEATKAIAAEPPPMPTGPFRVIVVDPPWSYPSDGNVSRRAANPFPTMPLADIRTLDVGSMAHDNAVLWMWTTNTHIPAAWDIINAWGFTYKTMLTWVKDRMGTGDWLRGQTEHCLMCVRGKPTINLTNQTTALHGPLRQHSQKPDEFYTLVEKLCPGSKVELFSRQQRQGWAAHGNELPIAAKN